MGNDIKNFEELAGRVATLEKSNRRMKTALAVTIAAISAALVIGAGPAKRIIEGERFAFRDASGKERLTLDSTPQGPACVIHDINGKPSFKVFINKDGFFQMPNQAAEQPSSQKKQQK